MGYKNCIFGQPMSLEAGYKALRLDVEKSNIETRATLNEAFFGFTGYG